MNSIRRISCVGSVKLVTSASPSVFEIGDSTEINPLSYAIAVQRERAIFKQDEFNFRDYSLFHRPLMMPAVNENIQMKTYNELPAIRVGYIDLFNISSSGTVHIGSSCSMKAETRIKHIRHLFRERPE